MGVEWVWLNLLWFIIIRCGSILFTVFCGNDVLKEAKAVRMRTWDVYALKG